MNPDASNNVDGQFEFSGKGGEYFRIWIVNLALTILTLGIYSAWAKVRRLQYFHRNTALIGNSFDLPAFFANESAGFLGFDPAKICPG